MDLAVLDATFFVPVSTNPELEFVAINDITDAKTLAHLLRYDSVHGQLDANIVAEDNALVVDGKRIEIIQERDPGKLPWGNLGVDIALESTGLFYRTGTSLIASVGRRQKGHYFCPSQKS